MRTGKNQQDIKKMNRELVFKLICTGQCLSRIDVSRLTGLTKMTVTNITNKLMEEGLVREGLPTENEGTVGRKPVVLLPNDNSVYAIGVYISRDAVQVSLLTLSAKIIDTSKQNLSPKDDEKTLLNKVLDGINQISKKISQNKIAGIGIACIGPLDANHGLILNPPDFYGIHDVAICSFLREKTGLDVYLNNDMKASALAERLYGKGRGLQNFIYVGVTNGIGSGIFVEGKLFCGEMGYSGEIGHTSINLNGPVCSCGNRGCLEVYASIPNILKSAAKRMEKQDTVLKSIDHFTFADIASHAREDSLCNKIIQDMVRHLGVALVNEVNMLDLSTVILGHDAAYGGEYFAGLLEKFINQRILFKNHKRIKVEIAQFGNKCPVIGSGVLVLQQLFGGMI